MSVLSKSRKGTATDTPFIAIFIFMIAIMAILGWIATDSLHTTLSDMEEKNNSVVNEKAVEFVGDSKRAIGVLDMGLVMLIGFNALASIYFAITIKTNPIYFVASLLTLAITVFLTAELSNVFWIFANSNPIVTDAVNNFGNMLTVMKNYPFIFVGIGVMIVIGTYAKIKGRNVEIGV